ncbi:S41 family peptidase [Sphingomonas sp. LHG3406-1]|uniref:S41 family peptidase n=1 Tax=Sphingomonas sp. LHG3406-1 TaxID=2804617 RepID=UPI0026333DA6|nr:S41 family peptidase [Sphingomonas sp. LHG3406-1]
MASKAKLLAASAALLSVPALADPPAERDWGAALARDAQALHDDIAANHPGPVNSLDPTFAAINDRQLAIALERAKTARTYADYYFPLRIYVSAFDDGHLGFGALGDTPNEVRWPGFATRYDGRGRVVVGTAEPAQPVPKGAELVECDGMSADRYAEATLGTMWGRWALEAQRQRWGSLLFIDEGSKLVPLARSCTFAVGGRNRKVALNWQPLEPARVGDLLGQMRGSFSRSFGIRTASNGLQWIAAPSFNGESGSAAAKALPPLIARLRSDRAALLAAPAIVLDLRGNGGGSSDWGRQIADALWGSAALAAVKADDVQVDWRASPDNLVSIATAYADRRSAEGFSPEADNWFRSVIGGLGMAVARKQPLWRHVDLDVSATPAPAAVPAAAPAAALPRPVFVLTDASCASACLDAIDLWTSLGAIQIGRATSADTLYMDVRDRTLPSGLASISVPMKVYRGRKRGSNQPAIPRFRFAGDIDDTPALERWVATLAAPRR